MLLLFLLLLLQLPSVLFCLDTLGDAVFSVGRQLHAGRKVWD
jgi:hypothetical protein